MLVSAGEKRLFQLLHTFAVKSGMFRIYAIALFGTVRIICRNMQIDAGVNWYLQIYAGLNLYILDHADI